MTIDLSTLKAVQTALFIKLEIPGYPTLYMSDHDQALTLGTDTYSALGQFLTITNTSSDLRLTNTELILTLSGIPNSSLSDFMSQPIKGSKVTVLRGIFDPATHALLAIAGNPTGKFKGVVNNLAINEVYDGYNQTSTISLMCKSQVGQVKKVSGRRTNPADEALFFPSDRSMDRVPSLANAKFNFGGV